jgi:hypothetical protein
MLRGANHRRCGRLTHIVWRELCRDRNRYPARYQAMEPDNPTRGTKGLRPQSADAAQYVFCQVCGQIFDISNPAQRHHHASAKHDPLLVDSRRPANG